jgi:hypothetical protein
LDFDPHGHAVDADHSARWVPWQNGDADLLGEGEGSVQLQAAFGGGTPAQLLSSLHTISHRVAGDVEVFGGPGEATVSIQVALERVAHHGHGFLVSGQLAELADHEFAGRL